MGNFSKTNASTSNGFTLPEADFHEAIIGGLVDLGIVQTEYNGETKEQHKIVVLYYLETEIPDYEGKRYVQSKTYTFSFSDKSNLFKDMNGAFGSDFMNNCEDLETDILGKHVRVLIDHAEKRDGSGAYAKIDGLRPSKTESATMDGFELPKWIVDANERGEVDAISIFEG